MGVGISDYKTQRKRGSHANSGRLGFKTKETVTVKTLLRQERTSYDKGMEKTPGTT